MATIPTMHDLLNSPLAKPELIFKLEVANNTEIYYGFKKNDIVEFHAKQFGNGTVTPPYDYGGAMYFAVAVILIYGISIAFLIGTTLRKSRQDDEVKGFLRSYARLDDRKYEKQRVRKALHEKNLLTLVTNTSNVVAATIRRPSPWALVPKKPPTNAPDPTDDDDTDGVDELNILMHADVDGDGDGDGDGDVGVRVDVDVDDLDSDAVIEELQIITEDTELSEDELKDLATPSWNLSYHSDLAPTACNTYGPDRIPMLANTESQSQSQSQSKSQSQSQSRSRSLSDKHYETLDASKLLDMHKTNNKMSDPLEKEIPKETPEVVVSVEEEEDFLESDEDEEDEIPV